jgi:hypothetical protein
MAEEGGSCEKMSIYEKVAREEEKVKNMRLISAKYNVSVYLSCLNEM